MNYLVHVKMEENLHEAPPPHDHGCRKREGPMSPESSKFAGDSLRNVSQHEENLVNTHTHIYIQDLKKMFLFFFSIL